ncbi:MAG: SNF2-related protein [Candidatus Falkowbacteria bacterium GW2011_GWC2_38_22]|uniref:SNF2-related protein n=1 Tax=Candidatus Falkowbacteria bacterium GW2011_GWE1_38_31 TaxID=1618638 RepID=A0A0G0JS45_9BACT|nr:MAG: SNF2-related protein [Candidatus Falkowbacteria bacterium GW2011_GWF2_38_1205]KKQ61503.1 MAG: SNF2-related protein [Candidatus Falkowbacteria bacterium GW2011_GWC2_38_22]KKQ63604.1 MAG: SNF2-related protein [Candidatus Falkowbacteria bacterium GW2011_GWF1_38_22]KKQ65756.1 MAG: SNF2-related protein [Candidatus Falkowbacteria bacterium GW2011_GWE2_38_254]KKQ70373.1 MAG: SNF2-related protein [Candidatus Falkowbacteria bacterium GW2011_GWE1_38_31]KKQ72878.1 MAG: SNF2-related protein [Candi
MFDRKVLQKNLKKYFEPHIYSRGENYYGTGQVESLKAFPVKNKEQIEIRGIITGSDYYQAGIIFDLENNSFSRLNCDCPYYDNCKHLAALGLEFIDLLDAFAYENGRLIKTGDVSTQLIEWVNQQRIALKYDGDDEFGDDYIDVVPEKLRQRHASKVKSKKKSSTAPYNFNDCHIILRSGYGMSLNGVNIITKNNQELSLDIFLQNKKALTADQEKLLKFLQGNSFFYRQVNYHELFELLQKSGLKIYWDEVAENRLMDFSAQPDTKKIKANLSLVDIKSSYDWSFRKAYVFKLDSIYRKKNFFGFLRCDKELISISKGAIVYHCLSPVLINIISRINTDKDYYRYGTYSCETELKEDEIINLDEILRVARQDLDFSTNLKDDFKVIVTDRFEPYFLIDYDSQNEALEIKTMIDYGFIQKNLNHNIVYRRRQDEDYFEAWGANKYLFQAGTEEMTYATVHRNDEIDLFRRFFLDSGNYGLKKNLECRIVGEHEIFRHLSKYWDNLVGSGVKMVYAREKIEFIADNFRADFSVDLNAENDWLGFDVDCYCGQDKVNLKDLCNYVNNKKKFFKLADGRLLNITNHAELERFVMMLESFYVREEGGFEGKLYHAPELEYIFTSSEYYNAKVKDSFNQFIKEAKSGKPVERARLKPEFKKVMRAYQREGVDWFYFLRKYRFAGILADDMGLGKTLQTLALLDMEKVKNKPSIVVCPKSILYNWEMEIKKFAPDLKALVIDGAPAEREGLIKKAKKCDLVITGYATMKKDAVIYEKEKIKFNYCVLDEAQFIKNHATKNAAVVKKIDADYRLALTGTPLENSVSEIWSVFDFLMPGFLGSYKAFTKKFQNPIMKDNNAVALDNLRKKVECFMLRRTKTEVLKELPPKVEQAARCHLEKAQNILYQEILVNVKAEITKVVGEKGFNKSRIHILAGLTKLRQVCNHPVLLLKDKDYTKYESAKLNMFMELMDEIVGNNRKVLVFSQFTKMLDILASELTKNNIAYNYLSGKTKNRQELVDDFNLNGDKRVFLISLKAGGTGLNLTSADNVIIFDPWWNPSVENQAIDRAHRIGQKNSVNVYRLITVGTIEERIVQLQERKKFLFDSLVGESKDLFQKLTWEDIKGLFE